MKANQAHRPPAAGNVNIYLIWKLEGKEFMLVAVRRSEVREGCEAEVRSMDAKDAREHKRDACRRNGSKDRNLPRSQLAQQLTHSSTRWLLQPFPLLYCTVGRSRQQTADRD
jgi:hypothetical protein